MIASTVTLAIVTISLVPYVSANLETNYNEEEARSLAYLSGAAYSGDPKKCVKNVLPSDEKWEVVERIEKYCDMMWNTCSAYVIRSDVAKKFIVVYRGTTTSSQLFLQGAGAISGRAQFLAAGKVHPYFVNGVNYLWDDVSKHLNETQYKSYPVMFTGHSLGGAMASIAAMKTVLKGLRSSDQVKLVSFGQPRVGGKDFVAKHTELVPYSFRVVHKHDMVPHIPPCTRDENFVAGSDGSKPCDTKSDGFYHHGVEIWYPEGMAPGSPYKECSGEPKNEDFNCSDQFVYSSVGNKIIADHASYFDRVVRFPNFPIINHQKYSIMKRAKPVHNAVSSQLPEYAIE
ncbi:unnamed protein product [Anisakis simplex]|uniref:Lipase_3 domain-containing protein n=1 Tax=Anisakis simplex TaxID=6269 RepID=A0A0M3K4F3_ANISI|nr:unnamed protein product [Anisakis simplex]